jgi:hypothetical protein
MTTFLEEQSLKAEALVKNLDSPRKRQSRILKLGEIWRGREAGCRCPIGQYQHALPRVAPTIEAMQKLKNIVCDPNENVRIAIMSTLSSPEPYYDEALEILVMGLKDSNPKVRINAIQSIEKLHMHATKIKVEIEKLQNDEINTVSFLARRILEKFSRKNITST